MKPIELQNVSKSFPAGDGRLRVLRDVNLILPTDKVTVVLGRSGCGKTTLLRLVGGLDAPDAGRIEGTNDVKTAFVFQEPRLMPWLTVWENIAFPLKKREIDPARVAHLIDLTGLAGFERARPDQLSGGMASRVALARALIRKPDYLLMDEPFAALDLFTRAAMQKELLRIRETEGVGALFVTHSVDEALTLANEIFVLSGGSALPGPDLARVPEALARARILRAIEEPQIA